MSHRIGRNNARNRANRKAKVCAVPLNDGKKMGDVIIDRRGRKYRIGEHGNLIRINL